MHLQPASFDQRLLAQTIDITILFPVLLILDGLWPTPSTWFWVLCLFIYHVYAIGTEASAMSATPGKKIAGLRVAKINGEQPELSAVLMRNLGKWLSLLPVSFGFFMIYFTKGSKAFHDKLTGTCVVVNTPQQGR